MEDWEQILCDARKKGLITFRAKQKLGDSLLADLRRKAEYRNRRLTFAILLSCPVYKPQQYDWVDYVLANTDRRGGQNDLLCTLYLY